MAIATTLSVLCVVALGACGITGGASSQRGTSSCSDDPLVENHWIDRTEGKSARDVFADPKAAALADAAKQGDTTRMRAIVRSGANVNAQGADGLTLLDWSIRRDNTTAFDFLLGAGTSPTIADKYGDNVIRWAARDDDTTFLVILLRHHVDPNTATSSDGGPPLIDALMADCDKEVRMLVAAKGIDLDRPDSIARDNALIAAAMINDFRRVLYLLKAGANPLYRNKRGDTFQTYLGMTPANVISKAGKDELAGIRAWLTEHHVPVEKGSS